MSNAEVANVSKKANSLQKVNFFLPALPCSMMVMVVLVARSKVVKAKAWKMKYSKVNKKPLG